MVMRNRHEGSDTPHWWDDLPPHVRGRFSHVVLDDDLDDDFPPVRSAPQPLSRADFLIDVSRFVILFLLISIILVLYLLTALAYVHG